MSKDWNRHECENLPGNGVEVVYSLQNPVRESGTWQLVIRRDANMQDIENNQILEEAGETVWETFLEITHCPFCGLYLPEADHEKYEKVGLFVHFDYSGYHVKKS